MSADPSRGVRPPRQQVDDAPGGTQPTGTAAGAKRIVECFRVVAARHHEPSETTLARHVPQPVETRHSFPRLDAKAPHVAAAGELHPSAPVRSPLDRAPRRRRQQARELLRRAHEASATPQCQQESPGAPTARGLQPLRLTHAETRREQDRVCLAGRDPPKTTTRSRSQQQSSDVPSERHTRDGQPAQLRRQGQQDRRQLRCTIPACTWTSDDDTGTQRLRGRRVRLRRKQ